MGYNAQYEITYGPNGSENDISDNKEICEIMEGAIGVDFYNGDTYMKWYSEVDDMKKFSKLLPNYIFTVNAIGEDGERWRNYYKNGQVQESEIVTTYSECTL